jgi:hypothetical protein
MLPHIVNALKRRIKRMMSGSAVQRPLILKSGVMARSCALNSGIL